MVILRIKSLYDAAWTVFRFQHDLAVADRDDYQTRMKRRLGYETASEIQSHVDAALSRIQMDVVNPNITAKREFYELLALEKVLEEITSRIEANAVFYDPDHRLLSTLGLSWRRDVLRLLDGQESPGSMPVANVKTFLGMVRGAEQQVPVELSEEIADHFRRKRRELVGFLERAVKMGEPIWCLI